jgi:hypothetical protein
MVLSHQTLSNFPSYQHQIEPFLCHWKHKTKSYKCYLNLKDKGTKQRTHEEKEWYFVSNYVSRPPLFLSTISCSFLIHFEWFQKLQMRYFRIYKTCLKSKVKKKKSKSWSFKIILNTYEKIQSTTPFILKWHLNLMVGPRRPIQTQMSHKICNNINTSLI